MDSLPIENKKATFRQDCRIGLIQTLRLYHSNTEPKLHEMRKNKQQYNPMTSFWPPYHRNLQAPQNLSKEIIQKVYDKPTGDKCNRLCQRRFAVRKIIKRTIHFFF